MPYTVHSDELKPNKFDSGKRALAKAKRRKGAGEHNVMLVDETMIAHTIDEVESYRHGVWVQSISDE